MSEFSEFGDYDALGLAELVKNKDVSATELLNESIERVEKLNPSLNAVTIKNYDEARAQIDAGLPDGPFKGVPFLLKDLHLLLKGTVTTSSCKLFENFVAEYDSTMVARYKQAGLVLFGKTNTPEFGLTTTTEPALFGPCRNPWNTEHSTGGSSGGAGAVVAARVSPMANASDGGGSIRIPASACGVFGMKPTRGRTPMGPDKSEGWNGCSISHAVSLSVRDNAALLDAVTGPEAGDAYILPNAERPFLDEVSTEPGKLKIGFSTKAPNGVPVDPECVRAVEVAVKLLEDLGHHVEETSPEFDNVALNGAFVTFIAGHTAAVVETRAEQLGRELTPDDLEVNTWAMAQAAKNGTLADYAKAQAVWQKEIRKVGKFFQSLDAFIQPVLAQPPLPLGTLNMNSQDLDAYVETITAYSPMTSLYNLTGQPSMSVPLHWTDEGLPVGTMITSRFGDEATLYRLAGQLERVQPWAERRPPVCI